MTQQQTLKTILKRVIPSSIWAALRKRRQTASLRGFAKRVVEHTYHDQKLKILIADSLGAGWYDRDTPWMHEVARLAETKLKPGAVVFDCGAHQGVIALILARHAGPDGLVVAVEANAHNHATAIENAKLNPDGRAPIEHLHAAVSDRDGTLSFTNDLNGQIGHDGNQRAGRTEVVAISLNTLASQFGKPDVIFLDIEGAEQLALGTATSLFEGQSRPDCFVEVHAGCGLEAMGGSAGEVVQFFRERGYVVEISLGDAKPFTPLDSEFPGERFFLLAVDKVT
jgi:FkbM family methyltransferase